MQTNIYQCCYTNATREVGGAVSSGWQAVCVSQDIPRNAYEACERMQNANASMQGETVDENGEALNLFELIGDGSYLYVCRTQFGLLDRLGRPNMFSHAYILPCREPAFINDPNNYLTIDRSSFKASEDEASQGVDRVRRREPFDLEVALQRCGLSDEAFATLIRCVYIQYMEKRALSPLFVQYDGSEAEMMDLLFCIYSALPLYMRRNLRVASAVMGIGGGKNIIFSTHADQHELYVLPRTSENNVLTTRSNARLDRAAFVDHVAQNHRTLDEPNYFLSLEELVIALGDPTGANERLLKIAHQMLADVDLTAVNAGQLVALLSDALSANILGNSNLDRYIARLMQEVASRQLALTPEIVALLSAQEAAAAAAELPEVMSQYRLALFCSKPVPDVARDLAAMDPKAAETFIGDLQNSDKGLEVLNEYYTAIVLERQAPSWALLRDVLDKTRSFRNRERIVQAVDNLAWRLYCTEIEKKQLQSTFSIAELLNEYLSVMTRILPPAQVPDCTACAVDEFWNLIRYSAISFAAEDQYRQFRNNSKKCACFLGACDLHDDYGKLNTIEFLRKAYLFFSENRDEFGEEAEILQRRILQTGSRGSAEDPNFQIWYQTVLSMPSEAYAEDVFVMYVALKECRYNDLGRSYLHAIAEGPISERTKARFSQMLVRICQNLDARKTVPLDLWLILSKYALGQSFDVFDQIHPVVLDMDPVQVVEHSRVLHYDTCMAEAESYVKAKGVEAKTVKRWLSVIQDRNKPHGGVFKNLLGNLSFRGKRQSEESASEENAQAKRCPPSTSAPARGKNGSKGKYPRS